MFQRITQLAAEGLRYSADLILPAVCVSCSALITRHNLLCPRCWSGMNLITSPLCERLGIPLPDYEGAETHISMQALANPPVFLRERAAAHYGGIIRRLIVRFKFEDKHEPLPLFIKTVRRGIREPQDLGKIGLTTLLAQINPQFHMFMGATICQRTKPLIFWHQTMPQKRRRTGDFRRFGAATWQRLEYQNRQSIRRYRRRSSWALL